MIRLITVLIFITSILSQDAIKSSSIVLDEKSRSEMLLNLSGIDTTKREEIKQYWQKEEIEGLEVIVNKQSALIYSCYKKFKSKLHEKRGFIKVKFEIKANGKVDRKSIKLLSTSIKYKELVSCVLKRVKYFKNFKPAKYSLAKNYVFEKKWNF